MQRFEERIEKIMKENKIIKRKNTVKEELEKKRL